MAFDRANTNKKIRGQIHRRSMRLILPAEIPLCMAVLVLFSPPIPCETKHVKQNEHRASQWAYLFTAVWRTHSHRQGCRAVFNLVFFGLQSQRTEIKQKSPFSNTFSFQWTRNFFRIALCGQESFLAMILIRSETLKCIWKSFWTLTVHRNVIFYGLRTDSDTKTFRRSP